MKAIIHSNLILENGILFDGALLLDGGTIARFGPMSQLEIPPDTEMLDAGGRYVGPGFVDLHCHGGNGAMFDMAPAEAAAHFLRHGTTTVLATLYYDLSHTQMLASIARIRRVMGETAEGGAIGGIYMEGPYMNPIYGASPEKNKWRGKIDLEQAASIAKQGGAAIRVWAVAPEREGIEDFMRLAKAVNPAVVFAFGHTQASPAQIFALKKYGLKLQTHCTDATAAPCGVGGTRSCGPDEACFFDPEIYAEVICDSCGIHVHPDMLRLIARIKGEDRIALITDSFVSDQVPPEQLREIKDLLFDANGGLCGSRLTMDVACRNMMCHTTAGLCQVFKMGSLNPARAIGMEEEVGSIAPGKRANLVLTDDRINLSAVLLNGKVVEGGF